jgi:GT2 family glycosyltransferase
MNFPADQLEILVVNTGSGNTGAESVARALGARYERHADAGVAAARNHGAARASGELLVFVDDDIVVGPENLRQHEAIHAEYERCLVSGHWEFDPETRRALESTPLGSYRLAREDLYNAPHGIAIADQSGRMHPQTLAAGNLSIRRELFLSLEGFDERFPVGAEDQDLTWRARNAGYTLVYDYAIRVIHNDQHADLEALCRRQERSAMGVVYFVRKHADAPVTPMVDLNAPLRWTDPPRLVLRKISRTLLSRRIPLQLARRLVKVIEVVRPNGGWPLEFLYNGIIGLYVFRGVRSGFRLTSHDPWPAAHKYASSR